MVGSEARRGFLCSRYRKQFSSVGVRLLAVSEGSGCSTYSVLSASGMAAAVLGVHGCFVVLLIFMFLIAVEVKHLSTYLLTIWICFLQYAYSRFSHFCLFLSNLQDFFVFCRHERPL